VLLVLAYLVFYLAVGQVVALLLGGDITQDTLLDSPRNMFVALVLPIGIGALGLLAFAARLGWLGAIFGPQPVRGRGWMWIAPVVVALTIAGHLAATEWDDWSGEQLALFVLLGACIGVAEELATRGLAVKMLRDAGHGERYVAVVSSLLFALMHTVNLLSGMTLKTVGATVVYTFRFGMCMYLAMRVTGTIWAAIVLHGLTDPTTFLATGGVDQDVSNRAADAGDTVALLATLLMMLVGLLATFLVRGRR
jgi:membrane protease YdiL (CAAX protease family)